METNETNQQDGTLPPEEDFRNLSREECLEILGLPGDAADDAIKKKYGALLRQYKRQVDEYGETYESLAYYRRITGAYDKIFGYSHDFNDDNPTSFIPYKIRRKYGKFLTWIEQYRLAVMLVVVIIVLALVFILQNLGPKSDLKLKFVGAYIQSLSSNLSEEMNERSEVFNKVQISFFTVTTDTSLLDATARTNAEAFLGQLMAPGQLDVVLIDKESYDAWVKEYAFLPLDEIYSDYCDKHSDSWLLNIYEYESEPDEDGNVLVPHAIYGIDVTDTKFFEDMGLLWLFDEEKGQEKSMIFCIARRSTNIEKSAEFLSELLNYKGE